MRLVGRREGILMKTDPRRRGQLGEDIIILQLHLVIVRFCRFRFMAKGRTIAAAGLAGHPGIQFQLAGRRHDQKIPQVGMPRPAEMRMAEPHDRLVVVLIAGAVLVYIGVVLAVHLIGDRVRVRA